MSARPHFGPDGDETRLPFLHVVQRRIVLFLFPDVGSSQSVVALERQIFDTSLRLDGRLWTRSIHKSLRSKDLDHLTAEKGEDVQSLWVLELVTWEQCDE